MVRVGLAAANRMRPVVVFTLFASSIETEIRSALAQEIAFDECPRLRWRIGWIVGSACELCFRPTPPEGGLGSLG